MDKSERDQGSMWPVAAVLITLFICVTVIVVAAITAGGR
jgi:hypothetical protein